MRSILGGPRKPGARLEFAGRVVATEVSSDGQCEITIMLHAHPRKIVFEYVIMEGLPAASSACLEDVEGWVDDGNGDLEIRSSEGTIRGRVVSIHVYTQPPTIGPGIPPALGRHLYRGHDSDPSIDGFAPP